MPETCDFCTIHTESYRILNRTDDITSFLSNPRLAKGHSLIIPNRHITTLDELNDNEVLGMHREANRLSRLMLGSIAMGVDRWQKSRPHVPEGRIKRNHLHLHVLPSAPEDHLYNRGIDWGGDRWTWLAPREAANMVELLSTKER